VLVCITMIPTTIIKSEQKDHQDDAFVKIRTNGETKNSSQLEAVEEKSSLSILNRDFFCPNETQFKETIRQYFEKEIETVTVRFYLPLRLSIEADDKGKKKMKGGMSSFRENEYIRLAKREQILCKYLNKATKRENEYVFKFATDYQSADFYELNMNAVEDCLLIFDIDGDKNVDMTRYSENDKNEWLIKNVPERIRNLPYTLSRNKRLPHYWCILEGVDKEVLRERVKIMEDCLTFCKGDIVCSHIWERSNGIIYNYTNEIPILHFNEIKEFIKTKDVEKFIDEEESDEDDDTKTKIVDYSDLQNEDEKNKQDLDRLLKLVECYTNKWMDVHKNWLNFTILFKSHFGNKYKKIWENICQQFPNKYNEEENNATWYNLDRRTPPKVQLTYRSFIYWAKECNPQKYEVLFGNDKDKAIDWSRLTEATYADKMYSLYFKDKLLFCGNEKTPQGYIYNGVYWENVGSNMCVLKKYYFKELHKYYRDELYKLKEELDDKTFNGLEKSLQELDKKLFRDRVIGILMDENWVKTKDLLWNSNNNLFAFENAVYDLEKGTFIEPRPEYYINMTCGYDYEEGEFTEEKKVIHDFFDSILTECHKEEEKRYLLKVLASFMKQENLEEKAYFLTGRGRNGKGSLTTLLNNVLGNYWGELNIEYYTNYDKGTNYHQQNLFNCRNARVLNTSEISEENENGRPVKFLKDKFLRITGQDIISARSCGNKEIAYFKAGKILIQTNTLPCFSKMTLNLRERIIVVSFPYTFTDDENLIINQDVNNLIYKRKDLTLKEKFDQTNYKNAFIQILFDYYRDYKSEGLIIPTSIKQHTVSYFNRSMEIHNWFFDKYQYQFEDLTEEEIRKVKKKDYNKIEISVLKNEYMMDCDIKQSLTEKKFIEELCTIGGIRTFIKKTTDFRLILQQWVKREEKFEDEGDEEKDD